MNSPLDFVITLLFATVLAVLIYIGMDDNDHRKF